MAWYNGSWTYRVKVTIQSSQVGSTLTDFPVFVDLSDLPADFHTNVKSDGGDIRVTTSDGSTECARELVAYNSATDTGELHFKAPSVSSSTDTEFYIYYGNSGASDYAVTGTYGRNAVWGAYRNVYHMADGTDSTGNDSLTTLNSDASTSGKIGSCRDYESSNSDEDQTGNHSITTTACTIEFWINAESYGQYITFLGRGYTTSSVNFGVQKEINGKLRFFYDGTSDYFDSTGLSWSTSTWYGVALRIDGTPQNYYRDGTEYSVTRTVGSDSFSITGSSYVHLGGRGTQYYDGLLDEVRIAYTDLGAGWVQAGYVNQNTPSTFYSVGTQETDGGGGGYTTTINGVSSYSKINGIDASSGISKVIGVS